MLGIVYLVLAMLIGRIIAGALVSAKTAGAGNGLWLLWSASFGIGTLVMTWALYIVSWMFSVCLGTDKPLLCGNIIVMGTAAAVLTVRYLIRKKTAAPGAGLKKTGERLRGISWKKAAFFGVLFLFITWIMFYVFYVRDGVVYSGFTVYGDYAPHTAMMRSFSMGNNFPTQYPHFGGADVKYHFMFQFLAGNLEYLGLRIDFAYNIISIFSLLGFLMLLCCLAQRLTGKFACGALASVFFVFRSGTAFFHFAWEHLLAGDLWKTLAENTAFIGYTANENWGLWNFNVYLNQRHLAFGLLLAILALLVFLDWLEAGCAHEEKGWRWLRGRLFSREAWRSRNPEKALLLGLLLGLCTFWNGAAVIGVLLILMGFAIFSDGKLDYALTAAVTVFFSFLQTKIFISGQAVSTSVYFGFLADQKTLAGVLTYLFQISGFFFLGLAVLAFFMRRRERAVTVAFLFPAVFAFLFSLTPDINVNHKYIMISYAFLTVFWAWAAVKLFSVGKAHAAGLRVRLPGKILAVLLVICLTATGIYDFVVILKDNDRQHRVTVNLESSLTSWLGENLEKNDLILTPEYSMNEVTMSGAMLYCGWPYYAWSAGYDTNYRAVRAAEIYTTADRETLKSIVKQEKITYILFEEGMEFEQQACREDIIAQAYPKVFASEDGRIRIYETR